MIRPAVAIRAAVLALAAFASSAARADVVPPRAVEVAESWLRLVDSGEVDEAVRSAAGTPAEAAALRARLRGSRPVRTRTIRSWAGHGDGDSERMAPGAYFALAFDRVDASGAEGIDEVRLVPSGHGDWRVVGFVRE